MSAELPKCDWIWRDGEFVPWESATIHMMSHVVHYGSSVFEGIRCYSTPDGPSIFRLRDHIRRLRHSARVYRMEPPFAEERLSHACAELVLRNRMDECYIRPVVFRGLGALGLNPEGSPIVTCLVCWPWGTYLGTDALEHGVDACISSWQRAAPNTFPVLAKAGGNYLSSQLIKMEAVANGFAEGIAVGTNGLISEGSGQNLFLVQDGTLITPAADGSLLLGITRDCILQLARDLGIPVRETAVPREMLYMADELFFTGTAAEVTPIRSVDRISIGDGTVGPVTRALQVQLLGIARGTLPDPRSWRTPVRG